MTEMLVYETVRDLKEQENTVLIGWLMCMYITMYYIM